VIRLATSSKLALARILRRLVGWARAAVGRHGTEVVCRRRGVKWSLDLDEGVQFALYLGLYERGTSAALRRLCPANGIVLDVGANIGALALPLAAALSTGGRVIAVEPADQAYGRLCRNVALNPLVTDRLQMLHLALVGAGDRADERYFASWPLAVSNHVHPVHQGVPQASTARASTLDALVRELALTRVDLIKLDVDGHELAVLRGGRNTLAQLRPTVVFEFCPYLLDELGESPHALLSIFEEGRYSLRDERTLAPISRNRDRLIRAIPHGGGINIVAVPQ
jgi:FkbM family methyltransferase